MALHSTANEFFGLLAGEGEGVRNIESVLREKGGKGGPSTWEEREEVIDVGSLAQALESKLLTPAGWGRMAWAAARVEYDRTQAKLIVRSLRDHIPARLLIWLRREDKLSLVLSSANARPSFPLSPTTSERRKGSSRLAKPTERPSPTLSLLSRTSPTSAASTPDLQRVSETSDSRACSTALSTSGRSSSAKETGTTLPSATTSASCSPRFRALADSSPFRSIILPSFLPRSLSPTQTFWHRAASTRAQTSAIVKSRWLPARAKLMALERERRSIGFEKEDERRKLEKLGVIEKLEGLGLGDVGMEEDPVAKVEVEKKVGTPSVALMGVSMLGSELLRIRSGDRS